MSEQQVIELGGRAFSCLMRPIAERRAADDLPFVIALHGGAQTSAYFDVDGYSLLGRAEALGIPIAALDRPGYGKTPLLEEVEATHAGNAAVLDIAIGEFAKRIDRVCGFVLIGHSIGGAIALRIAARHPSWRLLGVAISGVGLRPAPEDDAAWERLPPDPFFEMPQALKEAKMFGLPGTYSTAVLQYSAHTSAPTPRQELVDIVTTWPREVKDVLARVNVPIHYRQAAGDALWEAGPADVEAFAAACTASPRVDAAAVYGAGHSIDLHRLGACFQLHQLAFSLQCAADAGMSTGPVAEISG